MRIAVIVFFCVFLLDFVGFCRVFLLEIVCFCWKLCVFVLICLFLWEIVCFCVIAESVGNCLFLCVLVCCLILLVF